MYIQCMQCVGSIHTMLNRVTRKLFKSVVHIVVYFSVFYMVFIVDMLYCCVYVCVGSISCHFTNKTICYYYYRRIFL